MQVLTEQAESGRSEQQSIAGAGVAPPVGPIAILAGIAGLVGRAAEGVMGLRVVRDETHEHAPHIRQQQAPRLKVGVPLDLHGVCDVQPLRGSFRVEHQHRHAGVAFQIDQPKARSWPQFLRTVTSCAQCLLPQHRFGSRAVWNVGDCSGGYGRHVRDPCPVHGARMRAGAVWIRGA